MRMREWEHTYSNEGYIKEELDTLYAMKGLLKLLIKTKQKGIMQQVTKKAVYISNYTGFTV